MGITEQVNIVVNAREKAAEATSAKSSALKAWREDHQHLFSEESIAKEIMFQEENKLRLMAIEVYTETGDKAVAPGVGIRVMTKIDYDGKEAFKWAIEHKLALQLDTKKFASLAKDGTIDFVTISEEPSVTIAADLISRSAK